MGGEQRVPHSVACTTRCQNTPTLACRGDCGAARSSRAVGSPLPTRSQKKKRIRLTRLLQNQLDHVNILLRGLWARPPVLSLVPLQANHNPQKITSTICFGICGTGTSTICCTIRFDIHPSGITLITSTICSCGRLVLGQGAKVLSGSAQGICPPHPGR